MYNMSVQKYILLLDEDDEREIIVNAKTPLAAAKKFWRMYKDLDIVYLRNKFTKEEYKFLASIWMARNNTGKRKFK